MKVTITNMQPSTTATRGWTPINWVVTGKDEKGDDIYEMVQFPILPPDHHSDNDDEPEELDEDDDEGDESIESLLAQLSTSPPSHQAKKNTTKGCLQAKYRGHPAEASDQEMIDGDPALVNNDDIIRLARSYNMSELANAINASHQKNIVNATMLSGRLQRSVDRLAQREGRDKANIRQELARARKENRLALGGPRRKAAGGDGDEQKAAKKLKKLASKADQEANKENIPPMAPKEMGAEEMDQTKLGKGGD